MNHCLAFAAPEAGPVWNASGRAYYVRFSLPCVERSDLPCFDTTIHGWMGFNGADHKTPHMKMAVFHELSFCSVVAWAGVRYVPIE